MINNPVLDVCAVKIYNKLEKIIINNFFKNRGESVFLEIKNFHQNSFSSFHQNSMIYILISIYLNLFIILPILTTAIAKVCRQTLDFAVKLKSLTSFFCRTVQTNVL